MLDPPLWGSSSKEHVVAPRATEPRELFLFPFPSSSSGDDRIFLSGPPPTKKMLPPGGGPPGGYFFSPSFSFLGGPLLGKSSSRGFILVLFGVFFSPRGGGSLSALAHPPKKMLRFLLGPKGRHHGPRGIFFNLDLF